MLRGASLRAWVLTAVVAVGACAAPTLPLPPPTEPEVSASTEAGKVHLSSKGGVQPNAIVVIYNRNPDVPRDRRVGGSQADGEGSWQADVYASPGDYLDVTQEFGATRSGATTIRVPPR
ncbi:MAG: hypothetical protein JNL38_25310 [Myxococcales bacterium]|nr:hypothetical protein [Myxococcales bacterium]